jgi:hypothetical protein
MKPVVLDDLTRSELLRLIRDRLAMALAFNVTEADLIRAQWEEANSRLCTLGEAHIIATRERNCAWDAAHLGSSADRARQIKLLQILEKAEKAEKLADRSYKACITRCERLNKQYQAAIKTRRFSDV